MLLAERLLGGAGPVEGSRPEEDSRFPQFQPHPAGLLHCHHITVHTRAGVAQRATPRWPGSSARGAGIVVPAGPTRVGPEAAEGPASPRQRCTHALSRPRARVRDALLPRPHAGLRVGEPRVRAPAPSRAPGATLTSDTRRRLQRETAAGERRARPAVRGPRRAAELSRRRLPGREASAVGPRSCSGRASDAVQAPPSRRPRPDPAPRCPDSAHRPPPRGYRPLPSPQPAGCNRPSSGDEREATWKAFHQNEL